MTQNRTADLEKSLSEARSVHGDLLKSAADSAVERFAASSGCERCRGRGWVVTWDTLDSMSGCYAEYGDCPEESCTPESREKSGLQPGNTKYDRNRGSCWQASYTVEQMKEMEEAGYLIKRLDRDLALEISRWSVARGKVVRVVRGGRGRKDRRVEVGIEGIVDRVFCNDWGTEKCIVRDASGNKHWPTAKQVEVIDPAPDPKDWQQNVDGVPVIGTVMKKTAKATLMSLTSGHQLWIPYSQSAELQNAISGSTTSFILPTWLARSKGLL